MEYLRRVNQFFIGLSDAPKYGIIWTENGDVIDRVGHAFNTLWTSISLEGSDQSNFRFQSKQCHTYGHQTDQ